MITIGKYKDLDEGIQYPFIWIIFVSKENIYYIHEEDIYDGYNRVNYRSMGNVELWFKEGSIKKCE